MGNFLLKGITMFKAKQTSVKTGNKFGREVIGKLFNNSWVSTATSTASSIAAAMAMEPMESRQLLSGPASPVSVGLAVSPTGANLTWVDAAWDETWPESDLVERVTIEG